MQEKPREAKHKSAVRTRWPDLSGWLPHGGRISRHGTASCSADPGVTGGKLPVADPGGQVVAALGGVRAEGQVGGLCWIVQVVELVLAGRSEAETSTPRA